MSSELLGSAHNVLKGNLGGAWDINKGYADAYTDLGIARRFGGAAAAYSLRDVGAMNGRVVKARRSEDDLEEDFSASQVASGALEDWVNGKLENTLPADVATAAAAYSLRKVKANYSDDAVRIRRRADDAEVNVAFDSDDKVSSSSSISTVSGSTTATDLNGFLNEVLTVGVAVEGGESASARPDSFTNATNSSFTASVTEVAGGYFPYRTNLNDVIVVSFDIVLTGGATPSLTTSDGVNTTQNRSNSVIINSSGSYTETLTCDQNSGIATHIRFADSDDGTFAVTNFRVLSHTHSAFVHTWYDQAGSNDAVQGTADNQPKIAENGALLADGLDFDGTNDLLGLTSALGATTTQSIFVVQKNDVTTGGTLLFDNRDANDDGSAIFATDTTGNKQASWDAADAEHTATTNEELISLIKTSSAIKIIVNAAERDSTASSSTIDISNAPKIGASFSSSNHYDGSIKELICYNSDQSDNRFKIESNINNYYGLYTFQGDGFVETWYDQSGNGNDATQATAANQPAIVQNGGLSSDGLFFDGSNDSFEATDITNVNFPATVVSVSETNSTGTNRALYSLNNDSNACNGFYRSTNKYAINNGTTTLAGSETYTTGVHRLKFDLFNSASSAGFSNSVLDISGDIGTQVSQVTHFRIAGSLKTGITTPHSGTIKEIILYTSDKSSDRTDIETEINNHYNIY
jgi:hypothetical protein